MGKNLTQQKRGKGSPAYKAPSFKYLGKAKSQKEETGQIIDILDCRGHSAPLIKIKYETGESLAIAAEGIKVGDTIKKNKTADIKTGNTASLRNIPEGVPIFNLEITPGDGGKMVRTTGAAAKIITKTKNKVIIQLPSKKQKEFNPECMATIGIVAGAGRKDKPFLKAGIKYRAMKSKGKYWPIVSGASMNAVDHPLGGARSSRKGRPTIAPRNAPPGRKVGMIRPRHTGRNR